MRIKQYLSYNLKNIIGKSVKEKYIIIESDDWGSIRMPSIEALEGLKTKGLSLEMGESKRYNRNDTLASKKDLQALFEVLSKFKDTDGNHPVFTAVSLVANPDFNKIKDIGFQKYEYEPFTKTLERYGHKDAFKLWQQGKDAKLFEPVFHGREHLNVSTWMRALQNQDKDTLLAFNEGLWAINRPKDSKVSFQSAFDVELASDIDDQKEIIKSGLELFKELHGFNATYMVPPNGQFNNGLLKTCAENGVQSICASKIQLEPQGDGRFKKHFHWLGKKIDKTHTLITRNAFFEPNKKVDSSLEDCLKDIHYAFKWNKPAVISSHRVNYIGGLNPKNRENSLKELENLLSKIIKIWPDVKFISSPELANILS